MSNASNSELGQLYNSAHAWLVQNGEGHPAYGVEPELGPHGTPVVMDHAFYRVDLSGNEIWGIAPEAAQTLRIDGARGSFNMAAFEGAYERYRDGHLEFSSPRVMFTVMFPPDASINETTYSIDDPESGDPSPTTNHEFRDLDREWIRHGRGDSGLVGMNPEEWIRSIESDHCQALQAVVDALAVNWPAILEARRKQ